MQVIYIETNNIMATIKQDLLKLRKHLDYVLNKVDEGCELFEKDMPVEAEIAFTEAVQFSENLLESSPNDSAFQSILAETHHMVSLGYTNNEDYDKAFAHIEKALALYESFQRKEPLYEMTLHSSRARIEVMSEQHEKAIKSLEKIIHYFDHSCIESFRLSDYVYCSDLLLLSKEYYQNDQYPKAVEMTEKIIQYKRRKNSLFATQLFKEYLDMLHLSAEVASHLNDDAFLQHVLEEGIASCRQDKQLSKKSLLCSLATFYQDIIKMMFLRDDKASLKRYYEELIEFCDKHIHEEPRLKVHKISGQLNWAVFCAKERQDAEAEETVSQAIGGCMELNENGLEHTLFLFSALQTLANIKIQNGDFEGAVRELEREHNILISYLSQDLGKKPNLYNLLLELIRKEVMLYNEIGYPKRGEALLNAFKERVVELANENEQLGPAPYMAALKKIADIHWALEHYDLAKEEYQEVLMITSELRERYPELNESLHQLEDEIHETMSA